MSIRTAFFRPVTRSLGPALLAVFVAIVSALVFSPAYADGVVGNGTPGSCTETELKNKVALGGIITFDCGGPKTIQIASQILITQNTEIRGGGTITVTGGLTTRLFQVNSPAALTLKDIILDSGKSTAVDVPPGGGAILSTGTLTLSGVTIQNNEAGPNLCGGGIFVTGAVTILNSSFSKNSADYAGGAICTGANFPSTAVQISNTSFSSNKTTSTAANTGKGGAIFINGNGGTVTMTDTSFFLNTAVDGGALYVSQGGTASLTGANSSFSVNGNSATNNGGAFYNQGSLTVIRGSFSTNATPTNTIGIGYGGAIANLGTLTLINSNLNSNHARFGAGLMLGEVAGVPDLGARATLDRNTFKSNVASEIGGGMYANITTAVVTVTNSAFDANSAATGAGLGRFGAHMTILQSSVTRNTATNLGGGMWSNAGAATDGGYVEIHDSTFSGNTIGTGTQGGAIYNGAEISLQNVTIKDNTNGVFNFRTGGGEVMRMTNTVLQNAGSLNCDGDGTPITSAGGNVSTDNSCGLTGTGDRQGPTLDPKLGALVQDPFGPTLYHMPQSDSLLRDTGVAGCSAHDQRGASRSGVCDVGAIEFGGLVPSIFLPLVQR